jgi:hypothetical protein
VTKSIKTLARDYYAALAYAFKAKDSERLKGFLAADCKLTVLSESFIGKEAAFQFMSSMISLINRFEIRRQYFDHDSCCTVMDLITPIPDLHVSNIECIIIRDGQVVEINVVFDAQAWNRFMLLIENGDLFTAKTLERKNFFNR